MGKNSKTATLKRLGRIEGQVRGSARMVDDERYCIDIVTSRRGARRVAPGGGGNPARPRRLLHRACDFQRRQDRSAAQGCGN